VQFIIFTVVSPVSPLPRQLSIPIVCVCGAILVMHAMSIVENEEALPLKLSQMGTGTVYIHNPTGHHAQVEQQLRQQIELSGITVKTLQLRGSNDVKNGGCSMSC